MSDAPDFGGLLAPENPDPDVAILDAWGSVFAVDDDYARWQDDPAGFCTEVLSGNYHDDLIKVMESVRDNPVTIAKSANGTGKTFTGARIAAWWYKTFPNSQVYTAAAPPEDNLKRLLWGEIGDVVKNHPNIFAEDRVVSLHIQDRDKHFITGVTIPTAGTPKQREARFSGKHAPHLLFIIDEGDAVPPEVYDGIRSCMRGGHARLLVFFNPRAKEGPPYIMERDGLANVIELSALDHPNVLTGEDLVPGAVTREATVQAINEGSRPLMESEEPDADCFEVPEFLVGCVAQSRKGDPYPPLPAGWRKATDPTLWYMTFAMYPPTGEHQLIAESWINEARARWDMYVSQHGPFPPANVQPAMGLDVADQGKDKNAACFRYGGWVPELEVWGGVDPNATAKRGAALYKEMEARHCNVDANGVGAGVAPRMAEEGCESVTGVMVTEASKRHTPKGRFYQKRDELWWAAREWLRLDPSAMLPPDERLIEELKTPRYAEKNGYIRVESKDEMKARIGRSPDRADAFCLTFTLQQTEFVTI